MNTKITPDLLLLKFCEVSGFREVARSLRIMREASLHQEGWLISESHSGFMEGPPRGIPFDFRPKLTEVAPETPHA